jgi:hypothetical protein
MDLVSDKKVLRVGNLKRFQWQSPHLNCGMKKTWILEFYRVIIGLD